MSRRSPIALLLLFAACNPDTSAAPGVATALQVAAGDNQVGTPGYVLRDTVAFRVLDNSGRPLSGVLIHFRTGAGSLLAPDSAVTSSDGLVKTSWRLGADLGEQALVASLDGSAIGSAQVTAQARTTDVTWISGGQYGLCAVTQQGALGCWKPPAVNVDTGLSRWHPMVPGERFVQVEAWGYQNRTTWGACALTQAGRVWCFTASASGEPTPMTELSGGYPPLIMLAGTGSNLTTQKLSWCGLSAAGAAWCWGSNTQGQLGDGTRTTRDQPVQVATAQSFSKIYVGDGTSCALTAVGEPWCWGYNNLGQTGIAPVATSVLVPTAVPTALRFESMFIASIAGFETCGAVRLDGVYCWGSPPGASLSTASSVTPIRVSGTGFTTSVGEMNSMVMLPQSDLTITVWGDPYPAVESGALPVRSLVRQTILADYLIPHAEVLACGHSAASGGVLCAMSWTLFRSSLDGYDPITPAVVGIPPVPGS